MQFLWDQVLDLPDAASMPASVWTYRFSPMQEREQKRQYETSGNILRDGLAWTYTLLGGDNKQLATYNGVQGEFCGQNAVWMWPVEHNSYGPAQTRIITRPNGFKEYVIPDHLGSSRLTISAEGDVLQRSDYEPFGSSLANEGVGSRTSYIGREEDGESGLGFYGVRLYEPEYGRFTSVDPLWAVYMPYSTYLYCRNVPMTRIDDSGLGDEPILYRPVSSGSPDKMKLHQVLAATPISRDSDGQILLSENAYNCHSFAWSGGQGDPKDPSNSEIVDVLPKWDQSPANNAAEAQELSFDAPNQVGDVVVYFNESEDRGKPSGKVEATHSAVVIKVDECGNAELVMSKWGERGGYIHHPRDVPTIYSLQDKTATTSDGKAYDTRVYFRKTE